MNTSKKKLKFLAGLVWYTGFIALSVKSFILFSKAYSLNGDLYTLLVLIAVTLMIVILKVKYIFIKICDRNLKRIKALTSPKIWEFYRIRFFVFLTSMITLGAFLSRMAEGDYLFLMGVGMLDLSVGLSLFFSGFVFLKK